MRLYFIRHGETDWNRERRCQGVTDIPLNPNGQAQARALAEYFKEIPLEAIYSSPLQRALKTAEAINANFGFDIRLDEGLMELNQGELEGLTMDTLARDHSDLLSRWRNDPAGLVMPGGESMAELQERAWQAVTKIVKNHSERSQVAVIGHNLTITATTCRAISLDLKHFRRIRQSSAAINLFEFNDSVPTLVFLNLTHHLSSSKTTH